MSIGTYRPNLFHRLGDALNAFKGVPNPALLYPSKQSVQAGYLTFPGWPVLEDQARAQGKRDESNAKIAVTSPWVYADIQLVANIFSSAELIVKERKGAKLEDVDNHELERIWESPNEHMGRSALTAFWAWSYILSGKAYLYWVPDVAGTTLKEVWNIPPWMIQPIPDSDQFISGYAFKASPTSTPIIIPPEYITYSHSVNLFDIRDGLSFLAAALNDIKADLAMSLWNLNFFDENNGVPDGMISLSKDALDQDVERVRWELKDFFGGTKRGMAVARAGDMTYQEFGRSQKDIQFAEGRKQASEIVGRLIGLPDAVWSELSNRANAEQAMRTLINGAVWPLLVRLAEDMNAQKRGVVQRWYGEQTRVEFKDIRPEDKEAQRAELAAYQPFLTVNQLRERIGEEALDKDDVRGLMLVAEITKGAPLPGTPAAQLLDDLQAKKDEEAAQKVADQVAAGEIPDPTLEEEPPVDDGSGEMPPDEGDDGSGLPVTSPEAPGATEAPVKAVDDLALWERKALKAFKRAGKAAVAFESDVIDDEEYDRIRTALQAADSIGAIKAIFRDDWTPPEVKAIEPQPIVIVNQTPADNPVLSALADVQQVLADMAERPAQPSRVIVKDVIRDDAGRIVSVIEREQSDD